MPNYVYYTAQINNDASKSSTNYNNEEPFLEFNFHLFITFEASILGAASTARACSCAALKCNAACLSANTFKLTPYMSLCL